MTGITMRKRCVTAIYAGVIFMFLSLLTVHTVSAQGYRHRITGLAFPDTIGTMRLVKATEYEALYAGLGTGVSYRTDLEKADVFLYDQQLGRIPDGVSSAVIAKELERSIADIHALEVHGTYKDVTVVIEREVVEVEGTRFLHSLLVYEQNNFRRTSHIYLTGYGGLFLKLRITYPADMKRTAKANHDAFLEMVGEIIKAAGK